MITVHHLSNSHSHVVLWLLEELGVEYEVVHHRRDPVTRRSPDTLRAVHPAAKAPTIEDNGIAMVESTGIILYLLDAHGEGRLRPAAGSADAMRFYQWLTFTEGSAKGPLMQFGRAAMGGDEAAQAAARAAMETPLGLIEAALEGNETIVPGLFTGADIQVAFFEELLDGFGLLPSFPAMAAHHARMREREAYRRAEAMGGAPDLRGLFSGMVR